MIDSSRRGIGAEPPKSSSQSESTRWRNYISSQIRNVLTISHRRSKSTCHNSELYQTPDNYKSTASNHALAQAVESVYLYRSRGGGGRWGVCRTNPSSKIWSEIFKN